MSCGEIHETPCVDVLNAVDLLIDGEIEEASQVRAIEVHLQECPPCQSEMDHERADASDSSRSFNSIVLRDGTARIA